MLGHLRIPGTPSAPQGLSSSALQPPGTLAPSSCQEVSKDARLPIGASHLALNDEASLLAWADGSQAHLQPAGRETHPMALPRDRCHTNGSISGVFISSGSPPVLLALAEEFASAYGIPDSASSLTDSCRAALVARWRSSGDLRWRSAAWHPEAMVAALLTQQELCLVSPESTATSPVTSDPGGASAFSAASSESEPLSRLRAPHGPSISGPCALCWAEGGRTLAVNWGSTLELLRWQQGPQQDGLKACWAAESCSRRTLLLGLGEPLRCLAPIPGGGIVGTVDAPVPLSTSGLMGTGGDGAALLSGISDESFMSLEPEGGADGGILDLRGRFAQQQLSEPGVTVPSAFLLGSAPSTRKAAEQAKAQTARVVVVRPSELVQDAAWKPDQASAVDPAFVMPLGLPMPDILRTTAAPLVAVASSSGPPVVQLFLVKHEGLEPVSNVLLTLDHPSSMKAPPGSLPPPDSVSLRLRGLHVSSELKDAAGGTRKGVLKFYGLQARRLVEDAPFTSPSMAAILTLGTYEMAMEAELGQAPPSTAREPSAVSGAQGDDKHDAGAAGSAAEAQGMVKELAGLIAGLQGHLDARLDKVDRSLAEHDARLGVIEKQLGK